MSERWRSDYVADVSIGLGHINNYVIVNGITTDDGMNDCPLFLDLERPGPYRGRNQLLWQGKKNGACQWEVHPFVFWPE